MYPATHLSLTRDQLYQLAWSKPMRHLAKDYGVSDRGMAKLCARNQVPVPPRGYWARKSSGHKVVQPPLPAFVAKEKPKPEPPEPEVQKPAKKKAKPSNAWEDREKKIKQILRDHRRRLSGGVYYSVLIDSWSCDYSFGLNANFDPLRRRKDNWDSIYSEPFDETRWLVFKGKFLEPPQLKDLEIEVNLSRSPHLNEAERSKYLQEYNEDPPKSVGSLHKQKPYSLCFVNLPEDAMNIVLETASANKINFITLYGEKTRYGFASIFRFSLREKAEDDE
ncbi:MAG: hypothetical protein ACLPYB_02040 [Desulfobaccales bacterium]